MIDARATARTLARYDRNTWYYDFTNDASERQFALWRESLWKWALGPRVLELGVGTGRNVPYYPTTRPA